MAKNQNEEMDLEQEEMTVTLTLDDGSEVECVVLTIFEAGDRDYIALLPTEGAEAEDGEIMAVEHTEYPIYGVQFHPESVMTPDGKKMIENFINVVRA